MSVLGRFVSPSCFEAAILNFEHKGAHYNVDLCTIEKFTPENRGVAVEILFLSSIELEIPLGGNSTPLYR
jgi:hypothetical protein